MSEEEEILFEQYFQAEQLDKDERNFYLNLLANTKEVQSSSRVADPKNPLGSLNPNNKTIINYAYIDDEDTTPLFSSLIKAQAEYTKQEEKEEAKPFEIVTMALRKEYDKKGKEVVLFNGAISSSIENKWISGFIRKNNNNSYYVETHVLRYYEYLRESEKMYTVQDEFLLFNDKTVRISRYLDNIRYEKYCDSLPPFTKEKNIEYINGLVMTRKNKNRG